MGRFVNPDHSAFQVALNSEIYMLYLQQPSKTLWKIDHGKYADRILQQGL